MAPLLQQVTKLPDLKPGEIERAVDSFLKESGALSEGVDPVGVFNQMIEGIVNITMFNTKPHKQFWLAHENGEVKAFALSHWAIDVDGKMCLWLTDAWIHPSIRGIKQAKEYFNVLREFGKKSLCKHLLVVSSRNNKAYCRFLGRGWKPFLTVLKEDI